MAEYPVAWESDVVLSDGGTVRVRPIRPDDEARLLGLYERLSDESLYLRFFSPVPAPTAAHLERLTTVDYDQHMALVAQLGDDIVAVARYDRTGGDEAEVAFSVRTTSKAMVGHPAARAPRGGSPVEGHHDVHRDTLPNKRAC
jgi:hypothetical protein